jgi:signal transduction histidine kinase
VPHAGQASTPTRRQRRHDLDRRGRDRSGAEIEQALAAARDAAEAASRAKSAFLANTSHEVRTPLNGLLGLARLAMQRGLDEARRQQYLEQIFESAQSLSGIMSDILDLSKIEAGRFSLESVPFGLRDTLASVHDGYRALAEAKGLDLALAIDADVPATVQGDPVRVRQILTNFVTNALKFTERGRVRIHAGVHPTGVVRLSVSDTGPGIDATTQQRLFRPFSQADDTTTRRFGGNGSGLVDLPRAGAPDGRRGRRAERAGRRQRLLGRPAAARDGTARFGARRARRAGRPALRRTRCCWSRTTRST